ncbi:hypothetical protein FQN49_004817 [Arthroderma sp. PD_2]|nr:hypothetical protein FQN49_004817 [Arthroderma sp. PD_2]
MAHPIYRCLVGRSSKSGVNRLAAAENNLRFDNRVVSRNHAEFFADLKQRQIYLSDTCSMHGTSVNGTKLTTKPVLISNNDLIILGNTVNRGSESFDPVKLRVGIAWDKSSRVITSCETPPTNTFAVPEVEEESEAEHNYDSIEDIEHDIPMSWQDMSSSVSNAGVISVRSSLGPADYVETEGTSSQMSKEADHAKILSDAATRIAPFDLPQTPDPWDPPLTATNAPTCVTQGFSGLYPASEPSRRILAGIDEAGKPLFCDDIPSEERAPSPPIDTVEVLPHSFVPPPFVSRPLTETTEAHLHATNPTGAERLTAEKPGFAASANASSTKRKFDDSSVGEEQDSQDLPDAQPQEALPTPEGLEEKDEPPRKRVKISKPRQLSRTTVFVRYAATAITGAVVGGVGAVVALASLPPNFFD